MTSQSNQPIKLELTLQADQMQLLQGLEVWLQLGLLSDAQVRKIGRQLVCSLPAMTPASAHQTAVGVERTVVPATRPVAQPGWMAQTLTAFMAEISVIWLLFLGVFLVVVSSAVLAVSQWRNFSPVGQYAILWGYTLAFGGAGLWANQREMLRLTGQMLQIATLLIIPVNFWMIDRFQLLGNPLGLTVGAIAALSLGGITVKLLQRSPRLNLWNQLALCLLHWGWGIPGVALAATYTGAIGTAALQVRRQNTPQNTTTETPQRVDLGQVAIACSTLLLLGRAVLVQNIPLSQLGLAFGICGWLLCWVNRHSQQPLWKSTGVALLGLGWLVSITAGVLSQALGVSVLALWLLGERLRRLWRVQETIALLAVGLQTYTLLRVLLPLNFRETILTRVTAVLNPTIGSWELFGLFLFPYIWIVLGLVDYFRRSQRHQLAKISEASALGLGILLSISGIFSPGIRAAYLALSLLTLIFVLRRRSSPNTWLVYLTHIIGLLNPIAWLNWRLPDLSFFTWIMILLGLMIGEWGLCVWTRDRQWQQSSWHLGLGLALSRYGLLLIAGNHYELGLVAPLVLAILADWSRFPRMRQAQEWAIGLASVHLLLLTAWLIDEVIRSEVPPTLSLSLNSGFIVAILAYRTYRKATDPAILAMAWGVELLAISGWERLGNPTDALLITNLALGLGTQLLGDHWLARQAIADPPLPDLQSLAIVPLVYAFLGLWQAHMSFTATTGLYTLAAALAWIGVGRRQPSLKILTYFGVMALSLGVHELVVYQLLQASGGEAGYGLTVLALPGVGIAIACRLGARWLLPYWRLTNLEMQMFAHLHWFIGSCLLGGGVLLSLSPMGAGLWTGAIVVLTGYAIWHGRAQSAWVYVGVLQGAIGVTYWLDRSLPDLVLGQWGGLIAAAAALVLYYAPWERWGWPRQPWRRSAAILPGVVVILTSGQITITALLLVAAFYAWLAKVSDRVRLSYLSVILGDWALFRILEEWSLTEPLWFVTILSGSLLYGVQVDPGLQNASGREQRHWLRCLATGLFALTALYQAGASWWQGLMVIGLGLEWVAAGLILRVRAYLFIGTLMFMIRVLWQLWLFIDDYSMVLWALGIVLGLGLIWIAATFEARRSQAIALVQYWVTELERWE
jgi:hypothetical protein